MSIQRLLIREASYHFHFLNALQEWGLTVAVKPSWPDALTPKARVWPLVVMTKLPKVPAEMAAALAVLPLIPADTANTSGHVTRFVKI